MNAEQYNQKPVTYLQRQWRLVGENLQCQREGHSLFQAVSFQLGPGDSLLLSGPNGVGKTTLLEAIAGLRPLHQGELRLNDHSILEQSAAWHQGLCYLGHKGGNKKALTCLENLNFTCRIQGRKVSHNALLTALEAVGLAGYEHHLAGNLSAGQKKRLSLARLPLIQAPVWILDEPFVNLDAHGCQWLLEWLDSHLAAGGLLLITAHDNRDMLQRASHHIQLSAAWTKADDLLADTTLKRTPMAYQQRNEAT